MTLTPALLLSINNSQVAVAGEPGAYGVYKFGINSYEDVICYVRIGGPLVSQGPKLTS
jgi:hypothetical protein